MLALSSTMYFRWLEWPSARFLGDISYSLYLWQQLTLGVTKHLQLIMPVKLMVAVAFTIAAASFSYYVIERPFLKLKDKRFSLRIFAGRKLAPGTGIENLATGSAQAAEDA